MTPDPRVRVLFVSLNLAINFPESNIIFLKFILIFIFFSFSYNLVGRASKYNNSPEVSPAHAEDYVIPKYFPEKNGLVSDVHIKNSK